MIVYGSPGIGADTEAELGLAPGHGYVMETDDDPIQIVYHGKPHLDSIPGLGAFGKASGMGEFGPDPASNPNFTQLSTDEVTHNGVHHSGASGHSEYPRSDNGVLRTPGYNMSVIVAGLPELKVVE